MLLIKYWKVIGVYIFQQELHVHQRKFRKYDTLSEIEKN